VESNFKSRSRLCFVFTRLFENTTSTARLTWHQKEITSWVYGKGVSEDGHGLLEDIPPCPCRV